MLRIIILAGAALIGGCDLGSMSKESTNKSEYSVLQFYAYELQDISHENSYMIFQNALNTKLTVLAFPIKEKASGYVVILANAEGTPKVKTIPEFKFNVSKETYAKIKAEVSISEEVDQFILSRTE
jgi:hypothetical protein